MDASENSPTEIAVPNADQAFELVNGYIAPIDPMDLLHCDSCQ
jgi:hypothetical protein